MSNELPKWVYKNLRPSIFEDENYTVLELVKKLDGRVLECFGVVEGFWHELDAELAKVPQTVKETVQKSVTAALTNATQKFGHYPTGDTTGYADRVAINAVLSLTGACKLAEGNFYIDQPITLKTGYAVTGCGVGRTTIHARKSDAFNIGTTSADNLTIRDFSVTDDDENAYVAFNLMGTTTTPYTGARYSHFDNIRVDGFMGAIRLRGAWCVNFHHCRFFTWETAVNHAGTCNNVVYDHCSFIYADREGGRDFYGLSITAEGGSQNCGISLFDCDFEGWDIAVRGYCVIGLNVKNIYVEGCNRVFSIDSCPNFNCDGGYITYVSSLANVQVSNTANIYKDGKGAIRNVFVNLEENESNVVDAGSLYQYSRFLCNVPDPNVYLLKMENITAHSMDGNRVFHYDRDITQAYGCGYDYYHAAVRLSKSISAANSATFATGTYNRDTFKVCKMRLGFESSYTASAGGEIIVTHNGVDVYRFFIETGKTYAAGTLLAGTPLVHPILDVPDENGMITFEWRTTISSKPAATIICDVYQGEMLATPARV